jgi:hypothetical protein
MKGRLIAIRLRQGFGGLNPDQIGMIFLEL